MSLRAALIKRFPHSPVRVSAPVPASVPTAIPHPFRAPVPTNVRPRGVMPVAMAAACAILPAL